MTPAKKPAASGRGPGQKRRTRPPGETAKQTVSLRLAPFALDIADAIASDTGLERADVLRESMALGLLLRAAMCQNTGERDPAWLAYQIQPTVTFGTVFLARHGLPLAEVMGGTAGGATIARTAVSAALSAIDPTVRETLTGIGEVL